MTISARQPGVSTTQIELTDGTGALAREIYTLRVRAPVAEDLYVGPSGVTLGTGYKVALNSELVLNLGYGERVYGIAAGSGTAYVLQQRF